MPCNASESGQARRCAGLSKASYVNSSRKTGTSLKERVPRRARGHNAAEEGAQAARELPSQGTACPFERGWGSRGGVEQS